MSDMPAPAPVSRTHGSTSADLRSSFIGPEGGMGVDRKMVGIIQSVSLTEPDRPLDLSIRPLVFSIKNTMRRSLRSVISTLSPVESCVRLTGAGAGMSLMSGRTMAYGHNVP